MADGAAAPDALSPGGEAALAALAGDELKVALETIGIGEYDARVRGLIIDFDFEPFSPAPPARCLERACGPSACVAACR